MARICVPNARRITVVLWVIAFGLAAVVTVPSTFARDDKKDTAKKPEATKDAPKKEEQRKPEPLRFLLAPGSEPRLAQTIQMVDKKLEAAWQEKHLTPSKFCDDHEFIRRASLDIIGRIAKPEEIAQYFADPAATRRSQVIERLLKSDEYPRNWAN